MSVLQRKVVLEEKEILPALKAILVLFVVSVIIIMKKITEISLNISMEFALIAYLNLNREGLLFLLLYLLFFLFFSLLN